MNDTSVKTELRCAFLLFLTAAIWGFAMAFQREGSRYLQPFTFNAARYTVGILALLPFLLREIKTTGKPLTGREAFKGMAQGLALFLASFLQQAAVGEAGAGKAGFLTALYVVMVPVMGVFIGKRTQATTWLALLLALPALYLLCVPKGEQVSLAPLKLCTMQFVSAVLLTWVFAFLFEHPTWENLARALIPILYTGVMSTGVGYLFQAIGQKGCRPAFAALIMSLESVFCVIAGAIMLRERMDGRGYIGCVLMLGAVLLAQMGGIMRLKGGSGRV